MRHPHHVKAYTIKGHFIKGHEQKAKWVKKHWAKPVHVKGHDVGKRYVTKKVVKTVHTPTKKQCGRGDELGMCAVTAAGLLVGGYTRAELVEAYWLLSPGDDGVTIPEAVGFLSGKACVPATLAPGTILSLPNHAVVIDTITPEGVLVAQWGELHFMPAEYVDVYGEEVFALVE